MSPRRLVRGLQSQCVVRALTSSTASRGWASKAARNAGSLSASPASCSFNCQRLTSMLHLPRTLLYGERTARARRYYTPRLRGVNSGGPGFDPGWLAREIRRGGCRRPAVAGMLLPTNTRPARRSCCRRRVGRRLPQASRDPRRRPSTSSRGTTCSWPSGRAGRWLPPPGPTGASPENGKTPRLREDRACQHRSLTRSVGTDCGRRAGQNRPAPGRDTRHPRRRTRSANSRGTGLRSCRNRRAGRMTPPEPSQTIPLGVLVVGAGAPDV